MGIFSALARLRAPSAAPDEQIAVEPMDIPATNTDAAAYEALLKQEISNYRSVENVHDLPEIFHYWSNKYLLPMFMECGFSGIDAFFSKYLLEGRDEKCSPRFLSVGAGNGDTEIRLAKLMKQSGLDNFTFECLELNPYMIARGKEQAATEGLSDTVTFTESDFNKWEPDGNYSGVMANHSLHHVVNLEGLFDNIKRSLAPGGNFVTSDMIGRNGHMRWPEAMSTVAAYWKVLPHSHRYNHLLKRHEADFVNWDCSAEGFEGIRAQDILPLLVDRFDFAVFIPFANAVSPFVDRCFGHNFDPSARWDQAFIDAIHAIDEEGFQSGRLKPTQMLAVMTAAPATAHFYSRGISPRMAIREPD